MSTAYSRGEANVTPVDSSARNDQCDSTTVAGPAPATGSGGGGVNVFVQNTPNVRLGATSPTMATASRGEHVPNGQWPCARAGAVSATADASARAAVVRRIRLYDIRVWNR